MRRTGIRHRFWEGNRFVEAGIEYTSRTQEPAGDGDAVSEDQAPIVLIDSKNRTAFCSDEMIAALRKGNEDGNYEEFEALIRPNVFKIW